MTQKTVITEEQISTLLSAVLEIDAANVGPQTAMQQIPQWGSLQQTELLLRLRDEYGVDLAAHRPCDLESFSGLVAEFAGGYQPSQDDAAESMGTHMDRGLAKTILDYTEISRVDADGDSLHYRGWDAVQLATRCGYLEVANLLLSGELRPPTGPAVSALRTGVGAGTAERRRTWSYTEAVSVMLGDGQDDTSALATAWSALGRLGGFIGLLADDGEEVALTDTGRALEPMMILQADHGCAVSTLVCRCAGSVKAGLLHSLAAAAHTFSGPLHGGAMRTVQEFLAEAEGFEMADAVAQKLERGEPIPGFGHRVYHTTDPRVEPIRSSLKRESTARDGGASFARVEALRKAMEDRESIGMVANVDLYGGPLCGLMGFSPEQGIAVFACARLAGWAAHWMEQQKANVIIRPQLAYREPPVAHRHNFLRG